MECAVSQFDAGKNKSYHLSVISRPICKLRFDPDISEVYHYWYQESCIDCKLVLWLA